MWICYAFCAYYAHLTIPHCSIKNVRFGEKWQYVGIAFIYATVLFLGHTETYLRPFVSKTKCCDLYFFSLQLMFQKTSHECGARSLFHPCTVGLSHFTEFRILPAGAQDCLFAFGLWAGFDACQWKAVKDRETCEKRGSLILQVMFNLWIMFRCKCLVYESYNVFQFSHLHERC